MGSEFIVIFCIRLRAVQCAQVKRELRFFLCSNCNSFFQPRIFILPFLLLVIKLIAAAADWTFTVGQPYHESYLFFKNCLI